MNYKDIPKYLDGLNNFLKNPHMQEKEYIQEEFEKVARSILGDAIDGLILVQDCYTTNVFPRQINMSDSYLILWDNHFWDIYGRFLYMFFAYLKSGDIIEKSFFSNYYESMMLAYLAIKMEGKPAYARYIAESYSKIDMKYPSYNEREDIEKLLSEIGHLQEYNVAKMFAFAHETAHVAYKINNELMVKLKKGVLDYAHAIIMLQELQEEVSSLLEEEADDKDSDDFKHMYDSAITLTSKHGEKLLEEVCCDVAAILGLNTYLSEIAKMDSEQVGNSLSVIHYFYLCMTWLLSTEKFWEGLYEVNTHIENDTAFVDPQNPYYQLGTKITDEYKIRMNFTFNICTEKFGLPIDDSVARTWAYGCGFSDMLMKEAIGIKYMDYILYKAKNAKTDLSHLLMHIQKRDEILGWQSVSFSEVEYVESDNCVEPAIQYILDNIPSIRRTYKASTKKYEESALKKKQFDEALLRLELLEEYYGLNPNVHKYFEQGRLYYSYLVGSYMGSIDTISYDKRYEQLVQEFEKENDALVYHVIEHRNTIALLFVSSNSDVWEDERPLKVGIPAWVWDFDEESYEQGYIKVDILQGALYRNSSRVFESINLKTRIANDSIANEVVTRLNILKEQGLFTDLDIIDIFLSENEICLSERMNLFGQDIGIVQRISAKAAIEELVDQLTKESDMIPYFVIADMENEKIAILFVSEDEFLWDGEREDLSCMYPDAIIIDLANTSIEIDTAYYSILGGGPVLDIDE